MTIKTHFSHYAWIKANHLVIKFTICWSAKPIYIDGEFPLGMLGNKRVRFVLDTGKRETFPDLFQVCIWVSGFMVWWPLQCRKRPWTTMEVVVGVNSGIQGWGHSADGRAMVFFLSWVTCENHLELQWRRNQVEPWPVRFERRFYRWSCEEIDNKKNSPWDDAAFLTSSKSDYTFGHVSTQAPL